MPMPFYSQNIHIFHHIYSQQCCQTALLLNLTQVINNLWGKTLKNFLFLQNQISAAVVISSLSRLELFATPWTVACRAPLFMGFLRQEYRVGCHFLLHGISLTQGSNPCLLHWQADSLPLGHQGSPSKSKLLDFQEPTLYFCPILGFILSKLYIPPQVN